jgi:hypothetical protein
MTYRLAGAANSLIPLVPIFTLTNQRVIHGALLIQLAPAFHT